MMIRRVQTSEIAIATVFAVMLLALVAPSASLLRLIVGLPFIFLLPGRAILSAFESELDLGGVERFTVSVALSISLTIGLGMLLALSPLSLSLGGCVLALSAVTLAGEAIALLRSTEVENTAKPQQPTAAEPHPANVIAVSLVAMAVVVWVTASGAAFRPSTGELVQFWMLPDATSEVGGVQIGVDKKISAASDFTLNYFQGSESATETPLTLGQGDIRVFERAPLIETTGTAPAIRAGLVADGGRTRSRSVSWWPRRPLPPER